VHLLAAQNHIKAFAFSLRIQDSSYCLILRVLKNGRR
jgi:hypothetical protein